MSEDGAGGNRRGPFSPLMIVVRSTGFALALLTLASALWLLVRWCLLSLLPKSDLDPISPWPGVLLLVATLVLLGILLGLLGRILTHGRRHDHFAELNAALRRIASGDFEASVPVLGESRRHPFGEVAGEFNDMARALREMELMRQEFVATVSHDIQSPLTSIAGFARLLRDEGLPRETREHCLDVIDGESRRLSRLAEALLSLSALDAGRTQTSTEVFRLDEQIRRVILAAEPQWRAKNLELELELEEIRVRASQDMLAQVWTNLFHNAVKFSRPGGRVALLLGREGDWARLRMIDEGEGMAPEDLPFVFDRFFKADRSRSDRDSGSGLGLAIAKRIVELQGGSVAAESGGIGRGSTFTVLIPLETLQEEGSRAAQGKGEEPS